MYEIQLGKKSFSEELQTKYWWCVRHLLDWWEWPKAKQNSGPTKNIKQNRTNKFPPNHIGTMCSFLVLFALHCFGLHFISLSSCICILHMWVCAECAISNEPHYNCSLQMHILQIDWSRLSQSIPAWLLFICCNMFRNREQKERWKIFTNEKQTWFFIE